MPVDIGSKAPDFSLLNQDREQVRLSEVLKRQPIVLAFFPAAFSRVCTKEMCTFRDGMDEFNKLNANVLGISTDTFFTLKAWATYQNFTFPLLSDFNKEVTEKYGVSNPDLYGLKGTPKRAVFLIDQNGTVRYSEILDNVANEPDYGKLRDEIAKL
jgi:peroxiredoxin